MTRYVLAALLALLAAGQASADYLLIVVNLNAKNESAEGGNAAGMIGAPPLAGGAIGGAPPLAGGMVGGGQRGGGAMGGPPPLGGNLGIGGGARGMGGPGPGTAASAAGTADDADESPDLIVAVLEVTSLPKESAALFAAGKKEQKFRHKWGTVELVTKTVSYEATLLGAKGVPLHTVRERFAARKTAKLGGSEKPPTDVAIKEVALFALELGLVDECAKVMDDLAETDKTNAAVKAYLAVKADLAKPIADSSKDEASKWKTKLLDSYKISKTDKHHFALIHSAAGDDGKAQLDQLENTFRAYYYWWALRGVALPVPAERLVSVQTESKDDYAKLRTQLTASPTLADSFFARRESMSVVSNLRTDAPYDKLSKAAQPWWTAGYNRHELITGLPNKGMPKATKQVEKLAYAAAAKEPRTLAMLLKVMEHEYEMTGITHETSRQMLFATKQLPRNVHAPEWIQFGVGSFFETSLQSPWPSIGAANPYWLPRFKDLQSKKKYETSSAATLRKVVTDGYFREKPKGDKDEDVAKAREANLRKARAAAWSLTYYLARSDGNLPKLQRYFKELSKQPRDADLDEKALWDCFAKAFELDTEEKVQALANKWINYVQIEKMAASTIHEKIREFHAKMNTSTAPKQGNTVSGGNPGGLAPPLPGR